MNDDLNDHLYGQETPSPSPRKVIAMSSDVELLPCPFCGGTDIHMTDLNDEDDRRMWVREIECETCQLKMRDWTGFPGKGEPFDRKSMSDKVAKSLAALWNRRPLPATDVDGLVERSFEEAIAQFLLSVERAGIEFKYTDNGLFSTDEWIDLKEALHCVLASLSQDKTAVEGDDCFDGPMRAAILAAVEAERKAIIKLLDYRCYAQDRALSGIHAAIRARAGRSPYDL